ncbi:uncharacterized protein L3040_003653 [Drepanopeziza brunnea f. sp. 'multigermtubi']|uniref:Metallo-beta-lactamase superfamily protein n=1 Tax=Marssonina brunnea f. sp. multigermtubi (strain MB_m1) TaxID=1072389 RepID=K1WPF8_MARBU|nr:metallo-beta-lactamase superfamily protein [Drepanopeziza brunnea f. sp. 'multigermtubi' MB_m1]EKD14207.1 metallo-beta-lactamase superfamily protein [Drepanopeziza brunnea f. sp. 'multigermtubi' MB_m1]KAJ5046409.1 hypothetical protein L3040_003653 [Drepanopeziza brunnea f. sp. 'multigermtubi']
MATQLVQLKEIERLSARVIRVLGGNPGKFTLQGSNTYIVGTGRQRILIDTGEGKPAWIASLKEALRTENATITKALITHRHYDHVGGIHDLLEFSPTTIIYKYLPDEGQNEIKDGQHFEVEGASLRTLHSPGHTRDHVVIILEDEDAMFTGDNLLGHGTAVFEDLTVYLESLENMRSKFHGRAYPGHGAVVEGGPSKIIEYIKHRQVRENQVIQTLKSRKSPAIETRNELDGWTTMELVKVIYKNVPTNLHQAASGGILQTLRKLEAEEKVVKDANSERWRLKNRPTL